MSTESAQVFSTRIYRIIQQVLGCGIEPVGVRSESSYLLGLGTGAYIISPSASMYYQPTHSSVTVNGHMIFRLHIPMRGEIGSGQGKVVHVPEVP